ncbi:MAG: acyl-CoA dehydrogenase family protein, partial [Gammaproteobacteria bacterium]
MQLTTEQIQIRDTTRRFAREKMAPYIRTWEQRGRTPRHLFQDMAEIGLMGMTVDPKYGGGGLDFTSYALAIEELAAVDGGICNVMAANNSPVAAALDAHGTQRQKESYLRRLTSGEWLGSIHLTEPHTGSDAASISTRAVRDGNDYIVNGNKAFITAGASADLAMIIAVTDPTLGKRGISAFMTPTDNPGYEVVREENKLGHRTVDTCEIRFEDMRIPASDMLGEEGEGLRIALANLSSGRIGVAAQATGGARAALEAANSYANQREAFGTEIINHQAIAFKLADMATQVEAARQLYLHAADLHTGKLACAKEASMAKLFASEMAEKVVSDAIQIHGGYGYLKDYDIEKIYRDVRVYQIYEGTSEVQ